MIQAQDYVVFAAPAEWLDGAYKGLRDVSEDGMVLLVDGKPCLFGDVVARYQPLGGGWLQIRVPEKRIEPGSEIKLVTKMGGFVLFRGKGKDVEVLENPESAIIEKARDALVKVGLGSGDEF